MTTCGVLLALCDAMLGSGVVCACGFLCFAFPIRKSQRVGWAGKRPPMCSILLSLDRVAASTMPRTKHRAQALQEQLFKGAEETGITY